MITMHNIYANGAYMSMAHITFRALTACASGVVGEPVTTDLPQRQHPDNEKATSDV